MKIRDYEYEDTSDWVGWMNKNCKKFKVFKTKDEAMKEARKMWDVYSRKERSKVFFSPSYFKIGEEFFQIQFHSWFKREKEPAILYMGYEEEGRFENSYRIKEIKKDGNRRSFWKGDKFYTCIWKGTNELGKWKCKLNKNISSRTEKAMKKLREKWDRRWDFYGIKK